MKKPSEQNGNEAAWRRENLRLITERAVQVEALEQKRRVLLHPILDARDKQRRAQERGDDRAYARELLAEQEALNAYNATRDAAEAARGALADAQKAREMFEADQRYAASRPTPAEEEAQRARDGAQFEAKLKALEPL